MRMRDLSACYPESLKNVNRKHTCSTLEGNIFPEKGKSARTMHTFNEKTGLIASYGYCALQVAFALFAGIRK